MENITLDCGMRSFQINDGGVLRFNPADPNVYTRFQQALETLNTLEKDIHDDMTPAQLTQLDQKLKALLGQVFGAHNDFDVILSGVSLLATAHNGKSVIVNLMDALAPVLEQGAETFVNSVVDAS